MARRIERAVFSCGTEILLRGKQIVQCRDQVADNRVIDRCFSPDVQDVFEHSCGIPNGFKIDVIALVRHHEVQREISGVETPLSPSMAMGNSVRFPLGKDIVDRRGQAFGIWILQDGLLCRRERIQQCVDGACFKYDGGSLTTIAVFG